MESGTSSPEGGSCPEIKGEQNEWGRKSVSDMLAQGLEDGFQASGGCVQVERLAGAGPGVWWQR